MLKDHVPCAIKMAVHTRGRSVVWRFFTKVSGKEAKCEDCGDSIATCGNTTNLFKVYMLYSLFMAEHMYRRKSFFLTNTHVIFYFIRDRVISIAFEGKAS